jgi:hypothetical protein
MGGGSSSKEHVKKDGKGERYAITIADPKY